MALKLFGKSAAELLPAMKEGFRAASDSAAKMSEETINDLEAAGDAWGRLADRMTIISGTLIANTMKTTSQITKSWSAAALFADDVIKFGIGAATAMAKAREEAERGGKRVQDIYLGTAPVVHKTKEELDAAAAAAKRHATEIENLADKYNGMKKEVGNLAEVMRKMKPGDDWKGLAEDIGKLSRDGGKLTPEMTQLAIAFGTLTPAVKLGADGIENLGLRIDVAIPKLSAFNQAVLDLAEKTKWGFEGLPQLGFKVSDGFDAAAQKMAKDATASKKLLDDLAQSFTQLAQIGGDALGGIVKAFGTLVVSAKTAKEGIDSIKSGFSKGGLGGLLEMTTGFAGLASAAIAAGKAIWNLFHQNQGRDLVKDFAASMGGFDALQQKLLALGPEYDKLWRGLTQLNKNSSTQEAQAAIDAVTAALERQKGKTSEVAAASAEAAKKQIEAQQEALDAITAKYATTISKLDSEYQSLNDSVSKEAEEAVMGLVETQERARMDQIKAEKAAQEAMRDAEIAAKQSTFDDLLKDGQATNDELRKYYRDNPLEIPYSYVPKNTPGWAAPGEGIPPGASSASSGWPSGFTAPAGAAAGGDINIHNTLMMPDGDVLLKQTVKAGQRRGWM
ncbi:MAG TPA: hypothetical protein VN654_05215 [Vicinamibacterales bacterium]|nr:hypothetical protein [Vicinamibacterales bacterium]